MFTSTVLTHSLTISTIDFLRFTFRQRSKFNTESGHFVRVILTHLDPVSASNIFDLGRARHAQYDIP